MAFVEQEQDQPPRERAWRLFACLVVLLQLAPASLALFAHFPLLASDPFLLFGTALAILTVCGFILHQTLQWAGAHVTPLALAFTLVAFTAYLDIFLFLAVARPSLMPWARFYVERGEKYFQSSFGAMAMMWDGTFQLCLQVYLALHCLQGRPGFHFAGLVWAGSIINSLPPLLVGAAIGPYSHEIELVTLLNAPYILFPVLVAAHLMQTRPTLAAGVVNNRSPLDFCVIAFHTCMPVVHFVRVMVALKSNAPIAQYWTKHVEPVWGEEGGDGQSRAFMTAQAVQFAWWFVPYHLFALFEQVQRARTNTRRAGGLAEVDVSALMLGAYLQATACVVGASVFELRSGEEAGLVWRERELGREFWFIHSVSVLLSVVYFLSLCVSDIVHNNSIAAAAAVVAGGAGEDKVKRQ